MEKEFSNLIGNAIKHSHAQSAYGDRFQSLMMYDNMQDVADTVLADAQPRHPTVSKKF